MNWVYKRNDGQYKIALNRTLFSAADLYRLYRRIEKVLGKKSPNSTPNSASPPLDEFGGHDTQIEP